MSRFPHKLFVSFLLCVADVFAAWNGTSVLPKTVVEDGKEIYEITTPEELIGFRNKLDNSVETLYARLKNDIVFGKDTASLSEIQWAQEDINQLQTFIGSFDGQGHTIYGMNSNMPLFINTGVLGGVIKNLNVANCEIGADSISGMGGLVLYHAGGLIENVEVRNCNIHSRGITGGVVGYHTFNNSQASEMHHVRSVKNRVSGSIMVGGVVGYAFSILSDAFNSSEIIVDDSLSCIGSNPYTYVGGIVGEYTPFESDSSYTLDSVVNEGNISVKSCSNVNVGGIVGESYRSVVNGVNAGNISVEGNYHFATVGGIVGFMNKSWKSGFTAWNQGSKDLYNFGSVDVSSVDSVRVGGIVGDSRNGACIRAVNFGEVHGKTSAEFGRSSVGGVFGFVYNVNENALAYQVGNRGKVTSEASIDHFVGGVAGYLEANGSSTMESVYMQQAFNYGDVVAKSESAGDKYSRFEVGGIVGYANYVKIQDVYNRGNVIAESPTLYSQYAGGLAGKLYYDVTEMNYGYNACEKIDAKSIGGLVGSLRYMGGTKDLYLDSLVQDIELYNEYEPYTNDDVDELAGLHKSYTEYMQSDAFVDMLNTRGGTEENQKIWIRRDGYPVFEFDTLMVFAFEQKDPTVENPGDDDPEEPTEPPLHIGKTNVQTQSKHVISVQNSNVLITRKNGSSEKIYTILGRQTKKR